MNNISTFDGFLLFYFVVDEVCFVISCCGTMEMFTELTRREKLQRGEEEMMEQLITKHVN